MRLIRACNRHFEIRTGLPAEEVEPDEPILIECIDCYNEAYDQYTDQHNFSINERRIPATGPISIRGARKGDYIKVYLENISCADLGFMMLRPKIGPFGRQIYQQSLLVVRIDNQDKQIILHDMALAANPMVGFIAVDHGQASAVSNRLCGFYGGNMDVAEIRPPNMIYFPAYVDGGNLYFGDVHALMGNGEISGTGVETSALVQARFQVRHLPDMGIFVESATEYCFLGLCADLNDSLEQASLNAQRFVMQTTRMTGEAAMLFLGCEADIRLAQVVNASMTVKLHLRKASLDPVRI